MITSAYGTCVSNKYCKSPKFQKNSGKVKRAKKVRKKILFFNNFFKCSRNLCPKEIPEKFQVETKFYFFFTIFKSTQSTYRTYVPNKYRRSPKFHKVPGKFHFIFFFHHFYKNSLYFIYFLKSGTFFVLGTFLVHFWNICSMRTCKIFEIKYNWTFPKLFWNLRLFRNFFGTYVARSFVIIYKKKNIISGIPITEKISHRNFP